MVYNEDNLKGVETFMITLLIAAVIILILALVLMVILPIASILAIPVLIDATVIVILVKIITHGKKKKEDKK
jgi:hypothetical protein